VPLPVLEGVKEHRRRAEIERGRSEPDEVRADPRQLATDDADDLASWRNLDAEEPFDREGETHVRRQRAQVVHPVGVGNELQVRAVLGDLLHAAMEVAEIRPAGDDRLAVELEDDAAAPWVAGCDGPMLIVRVSGRSLAISMTTLASADAHETTRVSPFGEKGSVPYPR
jgi:hypothetical protein